MSKLILVTGGARSGKSTFAEALARSSGRKVTYIATAQIWDEEMAYRVQKHRQSRPAEWDLIEEPLNIKEVLFSLKENVGVVLLDCVTLWLSNLILKYHSLEPDPYTQNTNQIDHHAAAQNQSLSELQIEQKILAHVREASAAALEISPAVILVTNEVGSGIVPDNPLARAYRDLAGRSNQILAQAAAEVYLVVAGYPLEVKGPGQKILNRLQER